MEFAAVVLNPVTVKPSKWLAGRVRVVRSAVAIALTLSVARCVPAPLVPIMEALDGKSDHSANSNSGSGGPGPQGASAPNPGAAGDTPDGPTSAQAVADASSSPSAQGSAPQATSGPGSGATSSQGSGHSSTGSPDPDEPSPSDPYACPAGDPITTYTAVTEYQAKGWKWGEFHSAVQSIVRNGEEEIYFTYIDDQLRPRVGVIRDGQATDVLVEPGYVNEDDPHHNWIIAVDKDGYIHLMGDMHNHALRYWVSDAPYDLTHFSRRWDAIPGGFTYLNFAFDRLGELYMTARVRIFPSARALGNRGVGVYAYDRTTRSWAARGAVPPALSATLPVVFWIPNGSTGTPGDAYYMMYKPTLFFDKRNVMHLTSTFQTVARVGAYMNDAVFHARSTDGGITWTTEAGAPLTLPMGLSKGNTPDIVASGADDNYGEFSYVVGSADGRIGVVYTLEGSNRYLRMFRTDGSLEDPVVIYAGSNSRLPVSTMASGIFQHIAGTRWHFTDPATSPPSTIFRAVAVDPQSADVAAALDRNVARVAGIGRRSPYTMSIVRLDGVTASGRVAPAGCR